MAREHVARTTDADLTSPQGELRLLRAVVDVHSHPLLSPAEAAVARDALTRGAR